MSRRRRIKAIVTFLGMLLVCVVAFAVWQREVPAVARRQIERITGHHVTVAGVSLNHRLELVLRDVEIAGAPPFESQTLARAEQIVVRLHGAGGLLSPSEVRIDGLDIEYLGTAAGDNLRIPKASARKNDAAGKRAVSGALPRIVARNVRLRGNVAVAHAPRIEFRVPQAEFERRSDGAIKATLDRLVVDAAGWASLRVPALSAEYEHHHLKLASGGDVSIDIPGGGTLLGDLALTGDLTTDKADIEIRHPDVVDGPALVAGHWRPGTLAVAVEVPDSPLRALSALAIPRAVSLENAKAAMHANMTIDHARADFECEAKVQGIDVLHPAIDVQPWRNQSASIRLQGHADWATSRLEITNGELRVLAAPLAFTGWLEKAQALRGSLSVFTPQGAPLSCSTLLLGQPAPVRQALDGLELDGKLGLRIGVDFDSSAWENIALNVSVAPLCQVRHEANVFANLLPVLLRPTANEQVDSGLPLGPHHPDFVPLAQMPRHLPSAFLTSEDSKFFRHHGFDTDMIRHALGQDLQNHSFDRGASTITQQLAKNLFLTHRRTLARKLEEAVLTWRLQKRLTKDRVLELYLNVIELGPGIRGVKQAARVYFGKDVADLTPLESAHLAALTPNPHALARRFRDGQVDEGWQQRLYDLLGMMKRNGRLSAAELSEARNSRLLLRPLDQVIPTRSGH